MGFPCGSAGNKSTFNAGDLGSIPALGRSPGEGKGYPLQYSGLENSMGCIVHGVPKNQTWLSDFHSFTHITDKETDLENYITCPLKYLFQLFILPLFFHNILNITTQFVVSMSTCMLSHFSHVWLFATLWTAAHQVPLSMGFSRQEYWSGLPCPPLGDILNWGIKLTSVFILCIAGGFFTHWATWEVSMVFISWI